MVVRAPPTVSSMKWIINERLMRRNIGDAKNTVKITVSATPDGARMATYENSIT
jgi:hypothetical protein